MIKISPAILTNSTTEFKRQIQAYSPLFTQIDIDINIKGDSFPGISTVELKDVAIYCNQLENRLGFHLIVEKPELVVNEILEINPNFRNSKYYIHQESSFTKNFLETIPLKSRGVAIELESNLRNIEFYNQFSEVQLMTVQIGYQGQQLKEEALEKAVQLKHLGFNGLISIDGGVHLKNASTIKKYPIDRVSVGSYFSKSENIELDKMKLELALNTKESRVE